MTKTEKVLLKIILNEAYDYFIQDGTGSFHIENLEISDAEKKK